MVVVLLVSLPVVLLLLCVVLLVLLPVILDVLVVVIRVTSDELRHPDGVGLGQVDEPLANGSPVGQVLLAGVQTLLDCVPQQGVELVIADGVFFPLGLESSLSLHSPV